MRIKLTITYDGTDYNGWQRQNDKITIQKTLEDGVEQITGERVKVIASGRTDAGVHALGQVCHLDLHGTIPPENLARALNTVLPDSLKVLKSERAEDDFNARSKAKKKTYVYTMYKSFTILPLKDRYATRIDPRVDVIKMQEVAKIFVGEHDFKCLCASGSSVKTTTRTIYDLTVAEVDGFIKISVTGNGFLYNMVRIIAGTLLEAGLGKISKEDVIKMLSEKKRNLGGRTLSAKGLTLHSVEY